jgi:hypothetical protein
MATEPTPRCLVLVPGIPCRCFCPLLDDRLGPIGVLLLVANFLLVSRQRGLKRTRATVLLPAVFVWNRE